MLSFFFFFFSSRRRHTRYIGDWSSDVCSSDLLDADVCLALHPGGVQERWNLVEGDQVPEQRPELASGVVGALSPCFERRSEERRVGKECRSRWSPYE